MGQEPRISWVALTGMQNNLRWLNTAMANQRLWFGKPKVGEGRQQRVGLYIPGWSDSRNNDVSLAMTSFHWQ